MPVKWLYTRIPTLISCIPTLIPHIPILIPCIPTLITCILIIPLIPFPNPPFRLLQIAIIFMYDHKC